MVAQTGNTLGQMAEMGIAGTDKGWVYNLALDDETAQSFDIPHPFPFWFRPTVVREQISVQYEKMKPMGQSHGYHVYSGTDNIPISFELFVNRLMLMKEQTTSSVKGSTKTTDGTPSGSSENLAAFTEQIQNGRKYLEAMTVPPQQSPGIIGASPPPCILCLPGLLTLRMRLISLNIQFTDVDWQGEIIEMRCACTFEEAPMGRYTMEDVLTRGTDRTWGLL